MNYFEYFSEIEERFSRRRGSLLMLSTLDWALIETWREAGIPLAAVLRGIDDAFDKHDARASRAKGRLRKVNGLAWCAQAVMQAAEELAEAATGAARESSSNPSKPDTGFEHERVALFLQSNARAVRSATVPPAAAEIQSSTAQRLEELAAGMRSPDPPPLDELDRNLTVLEERLLAALTASAPEDELLAAREQSERELAPFRGKMSATQIRQIQTQFLHKRLFESRGLPRLSLFYMSLG